MKIGDIYINGQYFKHNPTWGAEDAAWKANLIFRMIQKNGLTPSTICEVGCGSGEILRQLQGKMDDECRFEGYDIAPQAINIAKQYSNQKLTFKLKNICEDAGISYDLILIIDLIEHLEDYFEFLRFIKAKSPYAIIHIPLEMFVFSVMYPEFHRGQRARVGHLHFFSKDTALQMLKDLGYEIVDYSYTKGYALDRHNYGIKDKILYIPRRLFYPILPDFTVRVFGGHSLLVLVK
jgi:hypothetical protein